MTSDMN